VIDPTVGTERKAIAARTEWGVFIGPDNGLLAPAVAMVGGASAIVSIENPELQLPAPGATFHGRDIFGPAAAVIASGQAEFEDLGPAMDPNSVVPMMLPLVEHGDGAVVGEVLWVDHFGNAQLNISPEDLQLVGVSPGIDIVLRVGSAESSLEWVTSYGDVEPGEALLHIDSYGQIAVAVRDGSAVETLPLAAGTAVTVRSGSPTLQIRSS
jgi:hypothetical protein